MDALIRHLRASGTGTSKINFILLVANGRTIDECYQEVIARLEGAGHSVTAQKVATWLVEHHPKALTQDAAPAAPAETREVRGRRGPRAGTDTETVLVPDPAATL